jgi:hypothetical protein
LKQLCKEKKNTFWISFWDNFWYSWRYWE